MGTDEQKELGKHIPITILSLQIHQDYGQNFLNYQLGHFKRQV